MGNEMIQNSALPSPSCNSSISKGNSSYLKDGDGNSSILTKEPLAALPPLGKSPSK